LDFGIRFLLQLVQLDEIQVKLVFFKFGYVFEIAIGRHQRLQVGFYFVQTQLDFVLVLGELDALDFHELEIEES
jgi:hypothetical protein